MKAIASCIPNLEFITQEEIKEILDSKSEITYPGRVEFEIKRYEDLAKFIYHSRSIIKAYLLIEKINFNTKEDIIKEISKIEFPLLKETFVVRCERSGNHNFNSIEIEKEAGEIIYKNAKIKVDLKNPDTTIIIDLIYNNCFIGIDFTGIKLSKREYRVRLSSSSINTCLAYCMIRMASIMPSDMILDPFCKSGEILIEAAQYLLKIPNCLRLEDKLLYKKFIDVKFKDTTINKKLKLFGIDSLQNNLVCAEINSKIASVKENIKFSKLEIEWIDTKFEKNSIDKIITFPIYPTNSVPLKKIEKLYKELFYQLGFVLKKTGIILILTPIPEIIEKYSSDYKFKKIKEIKINYTNKEFTIILLEK